MSKEERAHSNVIKVMKSFNQWDPFNFHSFRLIGKDKLVQPVQKEVHMLMFQASVEGTRTEVIFYKRDETLERRTIDLESRRIVL